jgi:hypothetical protein
MSALHVPSSLTTVLILPMPVVLWLPIPVRDMVSLGVLVTAVPGQAQSEIGPEGYGTKIQAGD